MNGWMGNDECVPGADPFGSSLHPFFPDTIPPRPPLRRCLSCLSPQCPGEGCNVPILRTKCRDLKAHHGQCPSCSWRAQESDLRKAVDEARREASAGSLGGEHETEPRCELSVDGEKYPSITAEFGSQDVTESAPSNATLPICRVDPMTTVTPANASTPIEEDLAGKVAVIDRGEVSFVHKAKAAQDKGAIAVIIVNSEDKLQGMGRTPGSEEVSIYVCCVSKSTGDALKNMGQDRLATFTQRTYLKRDDRPS